MAIGIGIDTGGTFTDAVAYDLDRKRVLYAAKAQTTKEDLSIGIGNALDGLPRGMLENAEMVSLSTTLATNACVENKGGRARLVFIGVDSRSVQWVGAECGLPSIEEILFLEGDRDPAGTLRGYPDWHVLRIDGERWIEGAHGVGIVELNAMDNNAVLEKRARDLVAGIRDVPVVCGHELFSDLNSIKRGASVLLNARLIPLIGEFMRATKSALHARTISAPIVVVRSDGSLMSEEFAARHPVETLLCGPAASVMGGLALTGEQDCLVIDMGGTTTDIAIVRKGMPVRARDGVDIGNWSTLVRGLFVDTFGLGGDSAVRWDRNGRMVLQATRLMPLSIAADRWPSVVEKLRGLVHAVRQHPQFLHEFFALVRDITNVPGYDEREAALCAALRDGPLTVSETAEAIGTDIYNLDAQRLEDEGVIIRCGLTPTDIMHRKGDFNRFNAEAAELGARFVASCIGVSPDALADMVYDRVKEILYANIVSLLIEDAHPSLTRKEFGSGLETLIARSWKAGTNGASPDFLQFGFRTPAVLVGIGAPIHIFLPDVARALGTRYVVPEHAGVANALGAVVGNVIARCQVEIKPQYTVAGIDGYIVFGNQHNTRAADRQAAIEIGVKEAREAAREEARRRGARGELTVTCDVSTRAPEASSGVEVLLGIQARATAIGKIGRARQSSTADAGR
jgi:N-methylhydantoinase A/oxoprolinase/acetone carboxylase beta subunit